MARGITVTVGRSSGSIEDYTITTSNPTVADALEAAGLTLTKGDRIRLNGDTVREDDVINNKDIITIQGRVSGGKR